MNHRRAIATARQRAKRTGTTQVVYFDTDAGEHFVTSLAVYTYQQGQFTRTWIVGTYAADEPANTSRSKS